MPRTVYPYAYGKTAEELKKDYKIIKQYLRLREQFEEDNNVLVHFNNQGLIFGIPQTTPQTLTFANLFQYLKLCFAFRSYNPTPSDYTTLELKYFEDFGLLRIKYRTAFRRATNPEQIKQLLLHAEEYVTPGIWTVLQTNGQALPDLISLLADEHVDVTSTEFQPTLQPPSESYAEQGIKNKEQSRKDHFANLKADPEENVDYSEIVFPKTSNQQNDAIAQQIPRDREEESKQTIYNRFGRGWDKYGPFEGRTAGETDKVFQAKRRYIDTAVHYDHRWFQEEDTDYGKYIDNRIPEPDFVEVLPIDDPRRMMCQFTGRTLDPDSKEEGRCEIFDSESIDLWNSTYEDLIRGGLDEHFPIHNAYPSNLSAVHAAPNMLSASQGVVFPYMFQAISVNPFDDNKIVPLLPHKEWTQFKTKHGINGHISVENILPEDLPHPILLEEHLRQSLHLRCVWYNAKDLYSNRLMANIPEAFRKCLWDNDDYTGYDSLELRILFPDHYDPSDKHYISPLSLVEEVPSNLDAEI